MSFLYNNLAVIVVAAVASALAWLYGGARGDLLLPVVPWLFVLLVEVVVCFPQRHCGETTYEARERVWQELRESKIVWFSCGFMALLMIPFFNYGLCTACDAALIAQGADPEPPVSFLPFCVSRANHYGVVMWFMIVLPSLIAVHHGLTRRGKRMVLELIVWNGAALAVLGLVQSVAGAPGPYWSEMAGGKRIGEFFSTFGYSNMAGNYFTTLFGLSIALWRDRCEHLRREDMDGRADDMSIREAKTRAQFWRRHYFLMPAAVFFLAAVSTLSRAAIVLVTATACVYFVHTLTVVLSRVHRQKRFLIGLWSLLAFSLAVFFAINTMPERLKKEVNSLGATEMLDRVTGRAQHHGKVAPAIWRDHPLFGVGGWGYAHFCVAKMKELDLPLEELQFAGGVNVHNDYLQLLAEHGIVGAGALLAIVIMLLWPIFVQWKDELKSLQFRTGKDLPPKPYAVFALPAPVFFILTSAVATAIHAFGDCPLRSCAALDLFFISLAALPGFMPRQEPKW